MPQHIASALRQASNSTGVNFSYLVQKASQESSFNPNAQAKTSSASGLFQFTKQTWLHMVKEHGDKYGLAAYADKITLDKNGKAQVTDKTDKQAILDLRKDPALSALMAGEYDKENLATLKKTVGGKIGSTELYLAHFLGAGGASDFISALRESPNASAASILPNAADANKSVFFNKDGSEKSVAEIYQKFARKFESNQPVYIAQNSNSTQEMAALPAIAVQAYNVASMRDSTSPITITGTPTSLNRLASSTLPESDSSASSLFATMVLAQMDMGKLADFTTVKRDKNESETSA